MSGGAPRSGGTDWDDIAGRIERSAGALRKADEQGRARVLQARAAALARPAPALADDTGAAHVEVLAFELAGERYAVETRFVAQALAMPPLTALPGVPNHVVGIVPFRGQVLAVLDLRSLLALPLSRLAEPAGLVVLHNDAMEFGLLADAIVGVQRHARASLEARLPGLDALRPGHLLGVAPDRTAILDAGTLLNDPTLVVQAGQSP